MGVGLAFPRELYSLSTFEISRIADTKQWPKLTPNTSSKDNDNKSAVTSPGVLIRTWNYSTGYLRNVLDPLFVLGGYAFGGEEAQSKEGSTSNYVKKEDPRDVATFYRAKKRSNQAIFERLHRRSDGRTFCVANYHNPCEITMRPIITFHAALYVEKAQRFACGNPLIVCGDFNMQPDSGGYQLITTAHLDRAHPEYPLLPSEDPWRPTLFKMESAYRVANGVEPEITNKAVRLIVRWGAEPNAFAGTLDYIFISKGIHVKDTVPLPSHEDRKPVSWPTAAIPSDHLMIGATFELPEQCQGEEESKL
jgi:endonuclease/exonuclease/phosphatase family metal-dependent hydrolase